MENLYQSEIYNLLCRYGYQIGDDKEYDCWRMYFGEGELVVKELDINCILAYKDGVTITANEGEHASYLFEWGDDDAHQLYKDLCKVITTEGRFLEYLDSLQISRAQIVNGADRDGELPMGYLLTWLRDNTGLPKSAVYNTAEALLKKFNLKNIKGQDPATVTKVRLWFFRDVEVTNHDVTSREADRQEAEEMARLYSEDDEGIVQFFKDAQFWESEILESNAANI